MRVHVYAGIGLVYMYVEANIILFNHRHRHRDKFIILFLDQFWIFVRCDFISLHS